MIRSIFVLLLVFSSLSFLSNAQVEGYLKIKKSSEINSSPWGIQIGTLEDSHLLRAADIGIKWTRLNASWKEIEKNKNYYSWDRTDQAFDFAIKNGITPFICLAGSNPLYCKETPKNSSDYEIYGSSLLPPVKNIESMKGWLKFVKLTVKRYKDKIKYWEIWNEPNHFHYWGDKPDGYEYGTLLKETIKVIKDEDSSAIIIAGALAGIDPQYTDAFLDKGNAEKINIITFHNYSELPEDRIPKALELWTVINKYNPKIQLWQGECGYPSHSNTRDYRGVSPWGLNIQAKWLLRQSFTDLFFCNSTLSNYFKLVHSGGRGELPTRSSLSPIDSILGFQGKGGSRVKSVGVNEKCLLQNPDLSPKPAFFAYQNLCSVFDNRYKAVKINTKINILDQGTFYGIGAEDDAFPSIPLVASFKTEKDHYLVAYWLPWHPQEIVNEAKIQLKADKLSFKDPVLIDLLSGKIYSLSYEIKEKEYIFSNIPLTDYPYLITERSEIDFGPEKLIRR